MSKDEDQNQPVRRKGARRITEIPPEILDGLNEGRLETITLVESLAIDYCKLLKSILPQVGLSDRAKEICKAAEVFPKDGVLKRLNGVAALLNGEVKSHPHRARIFDALSTHPSDTVRSWAALVVGLDGSLALKERLKKMQHFAADDHMGVREIAWMSLRPFIAADLAGGIKLLENWVRDADPNVRRCAVEVTRPRGVWCHHIDTLKQNPESGLTILEPVRADESKYVQRSVANWLNDASKSQAKWTQAVCKRWLEESKSPHTKWIVNHALRTIRKSDK